MLVGLRSLSPPFLPLPLSLGKLSHYFCGDRHQPIQLLIGAESCQWSASANKHIKSWVLWLSPGAHIWVSHRTERAFDQREREPSFFHVAVKDSFTYKFPIPLRWWKGVRKASPPPCWEIHLWGTRERMVLCKPVVRSSCQGRHSWIIVQEVHNTPAHGPWNRRVQAISCEGWEGKTGEFAWTVHSWSGTSQVKDCGSLLPSLPLHTPHPYFWETATGRGFVC